MSELLTKEQLAEIGRRLDRGYAITRPDAVIELCDNLRLTLVHCRALEAERDARPDPSKPFRGANCLEKPERLLGQPLGQYHCSHCGMMLIAGLPHDEPSEDNPDYQLLKQLEPPMTDEEAEMVLRESGTSGKEVVNGFIERLLGERSRLITKLREVEAENRDLKMIADVGTNDDPGTALSKLHKIQEQAVTAFRVRAINAIWKDVEIYGPIDLGRTIETLQSLSATEEKKATSENVGHE